jgi:hypothetical protein
MTTEQLLREALRKIKHEAVSLADAQVIALDALSAPAQPASGEAVEFDGYKGERQVRWYINELNRVRIINQWLADVYCNELRKFYKAKHAAHVKDERDIELRASNDLADLWRSRKDLVENYWLPGGDKPEDMTPFERFHDEVTKRLLSVFAGTTPPASQEQAQPSMRDGEIAALVNKLRDIAMEFHGQQQLRERIAGLIVPVLKAAQPSGEVVAYLLCGGRLYKDQVVMGRGVAEDRARTRDDGTKIEPLVKQSDRYTAPQPAQPAARVAMTEAERSKAFQDSWASGTDFYAGIDAAERHHRIGGITSNGANDASN